MQHAVGRRFTLVVAAADDPAEARRALTEAAAILLDSQARVAVDRIAVRLGRLPGGSGANRLEARLAGARLTEAGIAPVTSVGPDRRPTVEIRTLGGFEVVVDGVRRRHTAATRRRCGRSG